MTIPTISNPVNNYRAQRMEQTPTERPNTTRRAKDTLEGDRLSISGEARLQAATFTEAQQSDGIRAGKVAEMKARIAAGSYQPKGEDTAKAMVKNHQELWG